MRETELGNWAGGGSVPMESRCGGSLRTMAAGRGPPPPWGQQDSRSRWPQPRGAAVAAAATGLALSRNPDPPRARCGLTGAGALQLCLGKVTAEGSPAKTQPDRHGDPGPSRARSSCAVNPLVTGRSSSGCAFFLTSVGVLTNREARAHLCACACPGPVQLQASGDHGSPALWSSHSLPRPCCWVIPGTLWRLWVRAGACLLPRRRHLSGLASDIWTLSCLRSGWRVGQQTLLPRAQQLRLLLFSPFQSDLELQL